MLRNKYRKQFFANVEKWKIFRDAYKNFMYSKNTYFLKREKGLTLKWNPNYKKGTTINYIVPHIAH